jgi:hypothetical protein
VDCHEKAVPSKPSPLLDAGFYGDYEADFSEAL